MLSSFAIPNRVARRWPTSTNLIEDLRPASRQLALHFPRIGLNVQTNMSEPGNGQLPLAKRTLRSRISSECWEQIKIAYARDWPPRNRSQNEYSRGHCPCSRQASRLDPTDPGRNAAAIRCNHPAAISASIALAAILSERKDRTKLGSEQVCR